MNLNEESTTNPVIDGIANIILNFLLVKDVVHQVTIQNIDLTNDVRTLRKHANMITKYPEEDLELEYHGVLMEDNHTLEFYSIKYGDTINVLKKSTSKDPPAPREVTEEELQMFLSMFEEFAYETTLKKFCEAGGINKLLAATPILLQDPSALALLNNWETLILFVKPLELREMLTAHPVLGEALTPIIICLRTFYEEIVGSDYDNVPNESDYFCSPDFSCITEPDLTNPIYLAHLNAQIAVAITSARQKFAVKGGFGDTDECTETVLARITSDMVQNAVEYAITVVSEEKTNIMTSDGHIYDKDYFDRLCVDYQHQLHQLREMGFMDEVQNVRALEITDGEIQSAIAFILKYDRY